MHFFSVATLLLSMSLLTACSSGSSDDPDTSSSTNTVPTDNSSDGTGTSGVNDDDPDGQVDNGTAGEENTTDENSTDGDTGGTAGNENGSQGEESTDDPSGGTQVDEDSDFGQLLNQIQILTGRPLIALNQKLAQGTQLTDQENTCLGSYDPALGDTLLAIECEPHLATGDVPIFMDIASFEDSPACQNSLRNAMADECVVDQASMQIDTLFVVPEVGRPQPVTGALISYNIEPDLLVIQNLPDRPTGTFTFDCLFDITTGTHPSGDGQLLNCTEELTNIVNLINLHLASEL